MTAETLFELAYGDKIREKFKEGKYGKPATREQ